MALNDKEKKELEKLILRDMEYHTNPSQCSACKHSDKKLEDPNILYCWINSNLPIEVKANGSCKYWELTSSVNKVIKEKPIGSIPVVDLTKKIEPQQLNS